MRNKSGTAWKKLRELGCKLNQFYIQCYDAPYRQIALRQRRQHEYLFETLVMSELSGIPNPAAFYTLELMPWLIQDWHNWHQRMGWEHAPSGGWRCC